MSSHEPGPERPPALGVDEDIARASTIDVAVYDDAGLHARALERVFAPSWQLVVPEMFEDAPERGARAFTLLDGALDEPLLLTFDGDERRVLSNVCTHRGAPLLEDPTDRRVLVCPYHGRSFRLDGRLAGCPGFEDALDFPRDGEDLARLPLERVGPLAFTSIASRGDFADWAAPLAETLSEYDGETFTLDPDGAREHVVEASWALYCENYLEGFHIPTVHPGLSAALDGDAYEVEVLPRAVRQIGRGDGPALGRFGGEPVVADYLWLYPNLMVNAYPYGLSINVVEPLGPSRCRVRYVSLVARPELRSDAGAAGDLDRVELEDQGIVEAVARGVRSRLYPGGRFSPAHERGPHHFHRLLAADLAG